MSLSKKDDLQTPEILKFQASDLESDEVVAESGESAEVFHFNFLEDHVNDKDDECIEKETQVIGFDKGESRKKEIGYQSNFLKRLQLGEYKEKLVDDKPVLRRNRRLKKDYVKNKELEVKSKSKKTETVTKEQNVNKKLEKLEKNICLKKEERTKQRTNTKEYSDTGESLKKQIEVQTSLKPNKHLEKGNNENQDKINKQCFDQEEHMKADKLGLIQNKYVQIKLNKHLQRVASKNHITKQHSDIYENKNMDKKEHEIRNIIFKQHSDKEQSKNIEFENSLSIRPNDPVEINQNKTLKKGCKKQAVFKESSEKDKHKNKKLTRHSKRVKLNQKTYPKNVNTQNQETFTKHPKRETDKKTELDNRLQLGQEKPLEKENNINKELEEQPKSKQRKPMDLQDLINQMIEATLIQKKQPKKDMNKKQKVTFNFKTCFRKEENTNKKLMGESKLRIGRPAKLKNKNKIMEDQLSLTQNKRLDKEAYKENSKKEEHKIKQLGGKPNLREKKQPEVKLKNKESANKSIKNIKLVVKPNLRQKKPFEKVKTRKRKETTIKKHLDKKEIKVKIKEQSFLKQSNQFKINELKSKKPENPTNKKQKIINQQHFKEKKISKEVDKPPNLRQRDHIQIEKNNITVKPITTQDFTKKEHKNKKNKSQPCLRKSKRLERNNKLDVENKNQAISDSQHFLNLSQRKRPLKEDIIKEQETATIQQYFGRESKNKQLDDQPNLRQCKHIKTKQNIKTRENKKSYETLTKNKELENPPNLKIEETKNDVLMNIPILTRNKWFKIEAKKNHKAIDKQQSYKEKNKIEILKSPSYLEIEDNKNDVLDDLLILKRNKCVEREPNNKQETITKKRTDTAKNIKELEDPPNLAIEDNKNDVLNEVLEKKFNLKRSRDRKDNEEVKNTPSKRIRLSSISEKYFKLCCVICDYQAVSKKELEDHDEIHKSSNGLYKCDFCALQSNLKYNIRQHVLAVHKQNGKTYVICTICDYQATSLEDKRKHYIGHRSKDNMNNFKCHFCPYEAKLAANVRRHLQTHDKEGKNVLKCTLCGFEANCRKDMTLHNRIIHKAQDSKCFKCEFCLFQTEIKGRMKKHVIVVHQMNGWQKLTCVLCNFQAKSYQELKTHDKVIHKKDQNDCYTCSSCPYQVSCKRKLQAHIKYVHDNNGRSKLTCSLCDYHGKCRKEFIKHNDKEHRAESGNYKCTSCPFESPAKHLVKVHIKAIHEKNGVSKLTCLLCNYQALNYNDLRIHQIIHVNEGVKYYNCHLCSYISRHKANVTYHVKKHLRSDQKLLRNNFKTIENLFTCGQCGFETRHKRNMAMHLLKHRTPKTKERSFQCFKCNFETSRKTSIMNHFLTHPKEE